MCTHHISVPPQADQEKVPKANLEAMANHGAEVQNNHRAEVQNDHGTETQDNCEEEAQDVIERRNYYLNKKGPDIAPVVLFVTHLAICTILTIRTVYR